MTLPSSSLKAGKYPSILTGEIDSVLMLFSQPVLAVSLVDIPAALNNFSSPEPIINLTLRLDTRGHVATSNAVLVSNVTEPESSGVAGKLKGLFGKKDKTDGDAEDADAPTAESEESEKPAKSGKKEKVAIKFREKVMGIKAMSSDEKRTTMAR